MARHQSRAQKGDKGDDTVSHSKPNRLALKRLLYMLMVGNPIWADDHWDFVHTIAELDDSTDHRRVWWCMPRHISDPEGWKPSYISLSPGEFRLTRPNGPNDIIRNAPASPHPRRLSNVLKIQLGHLDSYANNLNEEMKLLKESGERLLRNMQSNDYTEGLNIFREEGLKLRTGKTDSAQDLVNSIYESCLFKFLLPGMTFAMAMTLLQIQIRANLWIEQDAFKDVRSYLGSFLSVTGKNHPTILEAAIEIGNRHFEDGQSSLKTALSSVTLESFYQQLYIAAHHFGAACVIANDTQEIIPANQLSYTALIAEESFSCITTGLSYNLVEFINKQEDNFEKELIGYLEDGEDALAERSLRDFTRPTNPILPKHYARVSMARALIQLGDKLTQKGVEMLHSLEKEFYSRVAPFEESSSELFRIESGLMAGYRELGDEETSKRYAARMVGRAIVKRALDDFF